MLGENSETRLIPSLRVGALAGLNLGFAIAVLWTSTLASLFSYIGFTLGISAATTVIGLIRLRMREGKEAVPIPGYPFIPVVFVVSTLGAAGFMVARQPAQAGLGLLTALAGIPIYLLLSRRRPQP